MCFSTFFAGFYISIHSLRMEGDIDTGSMIPAASNFNPLPPHGGRLALVVVLPIVCAFQSTPSAWRETRYDSAVYKRELISIHSLRMEGDVLGMGGHCIHWTFQSTPSAWRETVYKGGYSTIEANFNPLPPHGGRRIVTLTRLVQPEISIHSLRMEGDGVLSACPVLDEPFQSTPSAWRETSHVYSSFNFR